MKKFLLVASLIMAFTVAMSADIYIKTKNHTDKMMGKENPAKDEISEQWLGEGRMVSITKGNVVIMDVNKMKMFMVDHAKKSYIETALPLDFSKLFPPEIAAMMGQMKITVDVKANGLAQKVNGFNAKGYDVTMTMMGRPFFQMKVWASTEVPFKLQGSQEKLLSQLRRLSMQIDEVGVKEMSKIQGFWVASETKAGGMISSRSDVVEISQKAAPAGIYDVPAGYAKKTAFTMEDMQRQ